MADKQQGDVEIPVTDSVESKGGVKYEVVLASPSATPPRKTISPDLIDKPALSMELIESKLAAAHERKKSLEAISLNSISEKFSRVLSIKEKKVEQEEELKNALVTKMETNKENREARIEEIRVKARERVKRVEQVKQAMKTQIDQLMNAIEKKIENANEAREAQIAELLKKLAEHDKHLAEVRKQQQSEKEAILEKQQRKLEKAELNRNEWLKALQEKQVDNLKHVEEVRRKKKEGGITTPNSDEVQDENENNLKRDAVTTTEILIENN